MRCGDEVTGIGAMGRWNATVIPLRAVSCKSIVFPPPHSVGGKRGVYLKLIYG